MKQENRIMEKIMKYEEKHKQTVFPRERAEFLTPFVKLFYQNNIVLAETPPRIIAELAMIVADFRKWNTKEGFLTDKELSREVQKIHRKLQEEQ